MLTAEFEVKNNPKSADAAQALRQQPELATITYRSRAVQAFSEDELHSLLKSSQEKNRKNGLTGLLIYDEGKFFQWIEGHPDSLAKTWDDIQRDPRHTDIQLMGNQSVPVRFFGDWDMRLSIRSTAAFKSSKNVSQAPPELIDSLFRRPQASASLAADLREQYSRASNQDQASDATRNIDPTLRDVIQTILLPQLIARHVPQRQLLLPVDLRVGELVHKLMLAEPDAAHGLIDRFYAETHSLRQLCTNLIEPAARSLGDLWNTDDCTEVDVTVGVSLLQTGMRQATAGASAKFSATSPAVLVVPQPGEIHLLGATLDAESLYQHGWMPTAEFPSTDSALETLVSNTWFDALDLTLSTAFKREHWMPRVAETIAKVRSASRNPALVIIVGGRGFAESEQSAQRVGADAGSTTAGDVAPLILQSLHKLR